ncbi:MAG: DUF3795 domain-containing protein [Dehalococcoidia bacterium]|nr:DUF3795 domain-containing protein [Dehalococcoidia bacterium]
MDERRETYIGCCGAYCRTCRPFLGGQCSGCKLGYSTGERDIAQAKCAMKRCCLARGLETCGACPDFFVCDIITTFHHKTGYKYGRYRQSIEFIRNYGSAEFIRQANAWTGAYGRLKTPEA